MSLSAGEPIAAGVSLVGVAAASGMALFAAFGGSLIGAGIMIVMLSGQIKESRRAPRFLVSVFGGAVMTLCAVEIAERYSISFGVYTITAVATLLSFLAWKIFTSINNRGNSVINKGMDIALEKTLGIKADGNDEHASVDRDYIDSGRASRWYVGGDVDKTDGTKADRTDQGGSDGG